MDGIFDMSKMLLHVQKAMAFNIFVMDVIFDMFQMLWHVQNTMRVWLWTLHVQSAMCVWHGWHKALHIWQEWHPILHFWHIWHGWHATLHVSQLNLHVQHGWHPILHLCHVKTVTCVQHEWLLASLTWMASLEGPKCYGMSRSLCVFGIKTLHF